MNFNNADSNSDPRYRNWGEIEPLRYWLAWMLVFKPGKPKPDKVPFTSGGVRGSRMADVTNPDHWMTYEEALQLSKSLKGSMERGEKGVGVVSGPVKELNLILVVADLDKCRDKLEGYSNRDAIAPQALKIIDLLETYADISPSDEGTHSYCLLDPSGLVYLLPLINEGDPKRRGRTVTIGGQKMEIHLGLKYFTFTGHHLDFTPSGLRIIPHTVLADLLATPRAQGQEYGGGDDTNSAYGRRLAIEMKRTGHTFEQFVEALPAHAFSQIREWWADHKDEENQREFRRTWDRAIVDNLPHIELFKGQFARIAGEIEEAALKAKLPIYARGTALYRPIIRSRNNLRPDGSTVKTTTAVLEKYDRFSLRRALGQGMMFAVRKGRGKDGELNLIEPPPDLINMVLGGIEAFPEILGVIRSPTFRPDLSLITEQGFDEQTGLYLVDMPDMPPIPDNPSEEDARKALGLYLDLIGEFRFDGEVSRSVALSFLLTPFVRVVCSAVPGHFVTSPIQGSGKSHLVDVVVMLHTGSPAYVIAAIQDDKELEKQLSTAMLGGEQFILMDNLTKDPSLPLLAQAMERPRLNIRIFGALKGVNVDNIYIVGMTGNNVVPAGDNVRRTLVARLDPRVEDPLAIKYKGDPLKRVQAERGKLLAAGITMIKACIQAGIGAPPPLASYNDWSRLVRGTLIWLGEADPVSSIDTTFSNDQERAELGALLEAWRNIKVDMEGGKFDPAKAIKASQIIDMAFKETDRSLFEALSAIEAVKNRRGEMDPVRLGFYLRRNKDIIVGGRKINDAGKDKDRVTLWRIVEIKTPIPNAPNC